MYKAIIEIIGMQISALLAITYSVLALAGCSQVKNFLQVEPTATIGVLVGLLLTLATYSSGIGLFRIWMVAYDIFINLLSKPND